MTCIFTYLVYYSLMILKHDSYNYYAYYHVLIKFLHLLYHIMSFISQIHIKLSLILHIFDI